jgi:hypothetical protein
MDTFRQKLDGVSGIVVAAPNRLRKCGRSHAEDCRADAVSGSSLGMRWRIQFANLSYQQLIHIREPRQQHSRHASNADNSKVK